MITAAHAEAQTLRTVPDRASKALLRASSVSKIYKVGDQEVRALDGVTLDIDNILVCRTMGFR